MPIDFYYSKTSPPCRAVMMAARALDLDLKYKPVDLSRKEQLQPSFLKVNKHFNITCCIHYLNRCLI